MNTENTRDNNNESDKKIVNQRQEREIAESLRYASSIQHAVFPPQSLIDRLIPENFIFYQPREMVSGDFYFVSGRNDNIYVAVGDCTGHGVPGAFMSLLGITYLNEIISHNISSGAGSILNQLREHVMSALSQTGEESDQKDGIDLALCILDTHKHTLNFAGAFNPVYIIRDQLLIEISGDKMPVGVGAEEEKPFSNHIYELKNNDAIYLFTDGFVDQFGGPAGRKFKFRPFREMLIGISNLPMNEQKIKIGKTFDAWKGNQRQLDDVLVLGFRYKTSSQSQVF